MVTKPATAMATTLSRTGTAGVDENSRCEGRGQQEQAGQQWNRVFESEVFEGIEQRGHGGFLLVYE
jgi:hypothetical protein